MQEENKTEVVEIEEVKSSVLDRTRKEMKRAKKRILFSKISSITIPIIVAILLIGYPIAIHNINSSGTTKSWKNMIERVSIDYSDLEKTQSVSIEELNETKDAQFYWLENMTRIESYILTYKGKNTIIEEHYLYYDIECVLYIINLESRITELIISEKLDTFFLHNELKIKYAFLENDAMGEFIANYKYQFKINSSDTSTIETILSNLTNS